jgi:cation:H+ antiporter
MSGDLSLLLWVGLVVAGIAAMQWGAARAAAALDLYRNAAGLTGTVAGTLLGVATATPEISVNVASVAFGWPDLGLGTALGSNVPALPLAFLLAWLSLRHVARAARREPRAAVSPPQTTPVVKPAAADVQAWPYLLIVLLLAALTLPPPWAGLQPVDAAILVAAWAIYASRALRRPRKPVAERSPAAPPGTLQRGLLAVPVIAGGALAAVLAARRLADAFGASDLVVGLFVVGLLCALPESFGAWRLARDGRITLAISTAMADGIVSLTLAMVPPSLAGTPVGDAPLYVANLALLVVVLGTYLVLNHWRRGTELAGVRVAAACGAYVVYLVVVGVLLLRP